jgi:hypothetical protein
MKALNSSFVEAHGATTKLLLDVLKTSLGEEAEEYVEEAIHRKIWNTSSSKESATSIIDSTLIGTWSGPLTQFGATTKFVINIAAKDGLYAPTLDSPDQNAFGIPVSDFMVTGDSLSFKLGIASAAFNGIIDSNDVVIKGVWNQRGVDYPLLLSKQTKYEK